MLLKESLQGLAGVIFGPIVVENQMLAGLAEHLLEKEPVGL